jgi:hypothetical protein
MSILDGFSGYNQIKVKRTDKFKTPFITRWALSLMNVCLLNYLMQVPLFKEI